QHVDCHNTIPDQKLAYKYKRSEADQEPTPDERRSSEEEALGGLPDHQVNRDSVELLREIYSKTTEEISASDVKMTEMDTCPCCLEAREPMLPTCEWGHQVCFPCDGRAREIGDVTILTACPVCRRPRVQCALCGDQPNVRLCSNRHWVCFSCLQRYGARDIMTCTVCLAPLSNTASVLLAPMLAVPELTLAEPDELTLEQLAVAVRTWPWPLQHQADWRWLLDIARTMVRTAEPLTTIEAYLLLLERTEDPRFTKFQSLYWAVASLVARTTHQVIRKTSLLLERTEDPRFTKFQSLYWAVASLVARTAHQRSEADQEPTPDERRSSEEEALGGLPDIPSQSRLGRVVAMNADDACPCCLETRDETVPTCEWGHQVCLSCDTAARQLTGEITMLSACPTCRRARVTCALCGEQPQYQICPSRHWACAGCLHRYGARDIQTCTVCLEPVMHSTALLLATMAVVPELSLTEPDLLTLEQLAIAVRSWPWPLQHQTAWRHLLDIARDLARHQPDGRDGYLPLLPRGTGADAPDFVCAAGADVRCPRADALTLEQLAVAVRTWPWPLQHQADWRWLLDIARTMVRAEEPLTTIEAYLLLLERTEDPRFTKFQSLYWAVASLVARTAHQRSEADQEPTPDERRSSEEEALGGLPEQPSQSRLGRIV
uniref:RING-type domain-containing protein n=1 Tax=Macrostomum lignano TaxID=282301 RepID=A0A1I8G201_9PLAT